MGLLTRLPKKWSLDVQSACKRTGDKMFKNGVEVASIRHSFDLFKAIRDDLFLTKRERLNAAN